MYLEDAEPPTLMTFRCLVQPHYGLSAAYLLEYR